MIHTRFHWHEVIIKLMAVAVMMLGLVSTVSAQVPDREPSPLSIAQIHSGHSLTDSAVYQVWPGHYALMIDYLSGGNDNVGISTIPGSPMHWRWDHSSGNPDAKNDIADWELLVITEGVPMGSSGSQADFQQWVQHAWENGDNGNGASTLLYATWTGLEQGEAAWRAELDEYVSRWEAMADAGSAVVPDEGYVYIVPGNFLMMRLYDDIQAGVVPGVSSIRDFFRDDIHTSHLGSYALALMHIAVIHHVDPHNVPGTGWQLSPEPSPALTQYLQDIVWEIAQDYDRAGVPGGATPATNDGDDNDDEDEGDDVEDVEEDDDEDGSDDEEGGGGYDEEEDDGDDTAYVTTENVNLRKTPGGDLIKVIPKGTSATVPSWNTPREKDGYRWSMVKTEGSWGYVATDYIEEDTEGIGVSTQNSFQNNFQDIVALIQQLLERVKELRAQLDALESS